MSQQLSIKATCLMGHGAIGGLEAARATSGVLAHWCWQETAACHNS